MIPNYKRIGTGKWIHLGEVCPICNDSIMEQINQYKYKCYRCDKITIKNE